jgi:uncharacterized protein YbbK (DUF523 family)
MDDQAVREVVAMQFAGGMSIARLAEEWERDQAWVEEAIRQALLEEIPERDGGLKVPRRTVRAERAEEIEAVRDAQGALFG